MTEPHDWPLEKPAKDSLLPWFLSAEGYLSVLFADDKEARRARSGLLERGVPKEEMRLYESQQLVRIASRLRAERSRLAKAILDLSLSRPPKTRSD